MTGLHKLGYTSEIELFIKENGLDSFQIGRIILEHRERYIVSIGEKEFDAEITGNLRFSANSRADFPAVGDWVAITAFDSEMAIIHKVLPRKSVLERQAVGKQSEKQIISTNIDVAFIVQSIDNNFNINRLERYLTICYSAGIIPVLVVTKTDLANPEEIKKAVEELEKREKKIRSIFLSNSTLEGFNQIEQEIEEAKTYCLIGSSGVGKSTLLNNLLKKNKLETNEISRSTNKGKHTTTHRELLVLENGGIIIDTPGMRELGMTENVEGIQSTFKEIYELSLECRFSDCTHTSERGCAILAAIENGIVDSASFENFQKIQREQQHFQATVAEKRKKDKEFGKMIKSILKEKKKNK